MFVGAGAPSMAEERKDGKWTVHCDGLVRCLGKCWVLRCGV